MNRLVNVSSGTSRVEQKVTELMDEARRDAMRRDGWTLVRIEARQITWTRPCDKVTL